MRLGLFPGQQEFLRKAVRDADKYRGARRRFLAIFGVGVAGAAGAGFVGGRWGRGEDAPQAEGEHVDRSLLQQFRTVAVGPLPELIDKNAMLLAVLDDHPEDPLLWLGYERLAQHALLESDAQLRTRLLSRASQKPVPGHVIPFVEQLRRSR